MIPTRLLFAFDFVSLPVLGWLAAGIAPLLIHLWSRRRYQEMPWAAMQYLLAAMKAARRRTRLEQWLLLLLRTLIIVTVVLAAAEPYFEMTTVPFLPGVRSHRVFLLDGSFSMDYRPEEASLFESAKRLIGRAVEESSQGDGFSLVMMSDPARGVVDEPSFAPREFLAELEGLGQPHTGADLMGAAAQVERIVEETKVRYPELDRQEVYILTDLGRSAWGADSLGRAEIAAIRGRFERISESAELHLIDLGRPEAGNLAVTHLETEQAFAIRGRNLNIRAEVASFGRAATDQAVQLLVDGRRADEQEVRLEADGSAAVAFNHRFEAPGDHILEVAALGDRLGIDNRRWLAVSVKPALRVLCVDGQPGSEAGAASGYLVYALSPEADRSATVMVAPEIAGESALLEYDLHQYDCLFLVNVAQFTNSEARVLESYLKGGGGVVIFLGDRVMPERYNEVLGGAETNAVDLLPARLGAEPVESRQVVQPLEYRHPIVEVFRGQERSGLLTTPVEKYFPLDVPEDSAARTVLALEDGSPLVVERPVHRGRVILVATSADISWTPMPVLPSYVPIVQEMLAYAVADQQDRRNVLVGENIGATLNRVGGSSSVTIETPHGQSETTPLVLEAGVGGWDFSSTETSGVYTASLSDDPEVQEKFAVNVAPSESDLTKVTESELRQGVLAEVNLQFHTDWQEVTDEPARVTRRPSGLAKILLYLLLALMLAETYLARRFGHHR